MGRIPSRRGINFAVRTILTRRAAGAPALAALLAVGSTQTIFAQEAAAPQLTQTATQAAAAAQGGEPETVVVSGSRIVRDGFSSPTPVTVVGSEVLQNNATSNIADALNTMPNFAGSATPQNSAVTVTSGTQAINGLNIGGLGAVRTLVLVNGQRMVGSVLTGLVDVSELPQQLITRVDVVTGGASAGYGSDALTGIVNFVLDTKFTGLKSEISGGMTNYGDDGNYRVNLTAGTGFGGGRGHVEVSGEADYDDGLLIAKRPWNNYGIGYITNPGYKPGNGQPLNLLVDQIGVSTASYGGTIASGPFRGTKFGQGGEQIQTQFGPIVSDPLMSGGSWASQTVGNVLGAAIQPQQRRQNAFGRVSWDVSDDIEVYGQGSFGHLSSYSDSVPVFYPGNLTIQSDNAFLPANIAQGLAAAGQTSFKFGTFNGDLGIQHPITDRKVSRMVLGADGKFDMFGSRWTWDGYASYGFSQQHVVSGNTITLANYQRAIDAVRASDGSIVCRSTLTNPANGCVPLNLFGLGVASQDAIDYVIANPYSHARLDQKVVSGNLHGSPFNDWAGPVSFAVGIEHRREATSSYAPPQSTTQPHFLEAGLPYSGSFAVTEGYIETDVPLLSNLPLAKSLDLNAAVRQTHYSTFGTTRTWKVGFTYSPIDDLRFRATRSLDIREPTLVDLYQAGTTTSNAITDPFNNNATVAYRSITTGNQNLVPERAYNTVVGVVYQPSWLNRFSASFDYYDVQITGGITSFSAQQLINLCYNGSESACSTFTRDNSGGNPLVNFTISPLNFATERSRRFVVESTYALPMDSIRSGWAGTLGFRGSVTHYITDLLKSGAVGSIPIEYAGTNYDDRSIPSWKYSAAMVYQLDHWNVQLTARGLGPGLYSNTNIECTVGCPTSTANNVTVSDNHIAGALYFDFAAGYKFDIGRANSEVFFNARNMFNKYPPVVAKGPGATGYDFFPANAAQYDVLGAVFRLGLRVQL